MSEYTSFVSGRNRDCASCRLISGSGLVGAGLYVAYHSRYFEKNIGKFIGFAIGGVAFALGTARLLDLPPFRDQFSHDRKEKTGA